MQRSGFEPQTPHLWLLDQKIYKTCFSSFCKKNIVFFSIKHKFIPSSTQINTIQNLFFFILSTKQKSIKHKFIPSSTQINLYFKYLE